MQDKKTTKKELFNEQSFQKECKSFVDNYKYCIKSGFNGSCITILFMLYNELEYDGTIFLDGEINDELAKSIILKFMETEKDLTVAMEKEFDRILEKLIQIKKIETFLFIKNMNIYLKDLMEREVKTKKEDLINETYSNARFYCQKLTIEDVKKFIDDFGLDKVQGDLSHELLSEQEKINNIPDITKEDLFELYPEFAEKIDKDGLLDLAIDNYDLVKSANSDGMFYKDYFIYYDDFFIENKYTVPGFLDVFYDYLQKTKDTGNKFKIRLNYDKIISLKKYKQVVLAGAGFYGPNFNEEDIFTRIRNKTISTKKIRNNPKFLERFGNNIKETEFYLNQENSDFQIEEITQDEKNSYYINRFVHSEFDIKNKKIKHFDGELLYYKKDVYSQRLGYTLEKNKKVNESKKKIFRIDGQIDAQKWKELILQFFIYNEMILEYFDIDAYQEEYKDILDYENGVDY